MFETFPERYTDWYIIDQYVNIYTLDKQINWCKCTLQLTTWDCQVAFLGTVSDKENKMFAFQCLFDAMLFKLTWGGKFINGDGLTKNLNE